MLARVLVYIRVYGINIAFLVVRFFKYRNIFWTGILGDTGFYGIKNRKREILLLNNWINGIQGVSDIGTV
jgi:hypothetical protein